MSQTSRQRHYRHRRGGSQRGPESERTHANHGLNTQVHSISLEKEGSLAPKDSAELQQELDSLIERAKADDASGIAKDSEEGQELSKISSPSPQNRTITETLCKYLLSAFNAADLSGKPASNTDGSGNNPDLSSLRLNEGRDQVDILRALSAVLFENGVNAKEILPDALKTIISVCSVPKRNVMYEQRRMALNCLGNAVHKSGTILSSWHDKIHISTRLSSPLMDVICRFMFYSSESTLGQNSAPMATSTSTGGIIRRSTYSTPSNSFPFMKYTGPVVGASDTGLESLSTPHFSLLSSDSEYSDSDSGMHLAQRRQHDGKVRLNALLCLQALARSSPKQLQPHWHKFLTSSSSLYLFTGVRQSPSLVGLIGSDPIPMVRNAACVTLVSIVEHSKQYLSMAEEKASAPNLKTQAGMLALSERVGLMVRELHTGIAAALDGIDESVDPGTLSQLIRCCSTVVANCSYEKMRQGLTILLYKPISKYLLSPANSSAQPEVKDGVLGQSRSESGELPEFLCQVMAVIEDERAAPPTRIEAWGVLRTLAQYYVGYTRDAWARIDAALEKEKGRDSGDIRVRSASLLFLEEYCKTNTGPTAALSPDLWKDILERHILGAFGEGASGIKALGCDSLSHIPFYVFDSFPSRLQLLILSLVLGTAHDEGAVARAAACRAIGVLVLFPTIREDDTQLVDLAIAALELCQDPQLSVRVRASWAVGNLCDAFVLLKTEDREAVLLELLSLAFWTKIMQTALMVCQDHDKLKPNGVRAIGGLLRVTFEGILERERHSLVKEAVHTLLKHMEHGSLKGRWNACYAMQNILSNADFPIGSTAGTSYAIDSELVSWTMEVYDTLLHAIQQSKNFKVRISACAALSTPRTAPRYGGPAPLRKMVQVLMSTVQNLDEEQGEHEFNEFQYRGQLELRLLRCLDHLLQVSGGPAKLNVLLENDLKQRIVASREDESVSANMTAWTAV
ncbi:HEAT repeat-containing protein 6 [Lunasporangiospora selenospora]|uniref:HEAT repeat-containing protein 6 n=1 Tax=Lunasporangiospora selenospora TaxID=979761 RepID=A0A9P6FXU3_9FUNG|nr:HEAT repeat-containing protein 6 [Lunasporangiospora selenospora]